MTPAPKCHVCQDRIEPNQVVILREQTDEAEALVAPCCFTCWRDIPAGQRLTIAQKLIDSEFDQCERLRLRFAFAELVKLVGGRLLAPRREGMAPEDRNAMNNMAAAIDRLAATEEYGEGWKNGRDEDEGDQD